MSGSDFIDQKLVMAGNLMAEQLRSIADELDRTSGVNHERPERALPRTWDNYLERLRHAKRKAS